MVESGYLIVVESTYPPQDRCGWVAARSRVCSGSESETVEHTERSLVSRLGGATSSDTGAESSVSADSSAASSSGAEGAGVLEGACSAGSSATSSAMLGDAGGEHAAATAHAATATALAACAEPNGQQLTRHPSW